MKKSVGNIWGEIFGGVAVVIIILAVAIFIFSSVSSSVTVAKDRSTFLELKNKISQVSTADQTITPFSFSSDSKNIAYGMWYIYPDVADALIKASEVGEFSFDSLDSMGIMRKCSNLVDDACVCLVKIKLLDKGKYYFYPKDYLLFNDRMGVFTGSNCNPMNDHMEVDVNGHSVSNLFTLGVNYYGSGNRNDVANMMENYQHSMVCDLHWDDNSCNGGTCSDNSCGCSTYVDNYLSPCINNHYFTHNSNVFFDRTVKSIQVLDCFSMINDLNCEIYDNSGGSSKPCLMMLKRGEYNSQPLIWIGALDGTLSSESVSLKFDPNIGVIIDMGSNKGLWKYPEYTLPFSVDYLLNTRLNLGCT